MTAKKKQEKSEARLAQEAQVCAVQRRCRGPLLVTPEAEAMLWDRWRAVEGDWKKAIEFCGELLTAAAKLAPQGFVLRPPVLLEGDWEALKRFAFPLLRLRGERIGQPCGWDFNEEIVAHPFDGAEHTTDCPKCGNTASWKAPVFEDEEEG